MYLKQKRTTITFTSLLNVVSITIIMGISASTAYSHDHKKPQLIYDENGSLKGIIEYNAKGFGTYRDITGKTQAYINKPNQNTKGRRPYQQQNNNNDNNKEVNSPPSNRTQSPKNRVDKRFGVDQSDITIYTDRHGTYKLREVPTTNGAFFYDKSGRRVGQRIDDKNGNSSTYVDSHGNFIRKDIRTSPNSNRSINRQGGTVGGYSGSTLGGLPPYGAYRGQGSGHGWGRTGTYMPSWHYTDSLGRPMFKH